MNMPLKPITSDRVAKPVGPFSPAVRDGDRVYTSGQIAQDVYLTDMRNFAEMNEVYARHFAAPYPARTTVAVAALPLGAIVEIEMIAGN
jgi:2-iminobutanoate/2-iminopropanoate deaminase